MLQRTWEGVRGSWDAGGHDSCGLAHLYAKNLGSGRWPRGVRPAPMQRLIMRPAPSAQVHAAWLHRLLKKGPAAVGCVHRRAGRQPLFISRRPAAPARGMIVCFLGFEAAAVSCRLSSDDDGDAFMSSMCGARGMLLHVR